MSFHRTFQLLLVFTCLASLHGQEAPPVFGENLFFTQSPAEQRSFFNPNYRIAQGDQIRVNMWGAFNLNEVLMVDAQGNIFIPEVGPIRVVGTSNRNLNEVVLGSVKSVFKENVGVYANLESSQAVKVYVSGFVRSPGLYGGMASDSVLTYLQKAGGIDLERGSFIDVRINRADGTSRSVNLYDFLLEGSIRIEQFSDGDVVFVGPLQRTIRFRGEVLNASRFEFEEPRLSVERALQLAKPRPGATHLLIRRDREQRATVELHRLDELSGVFLEDGDEVLVEADQYNESIVVRVEGEHFGIRHEVLPRGARLSDLIPRLDLTPRSQEVFLRLFRNSVAQRRKVMIERSLQELETNVLTARSSSVTEAQIRTAEAELLLQFIERARELEPLGQVTISGRERWDEIYLEDGDRVEVPAVTNLVMVHGEVFFPNAQTYIEGDSVRDYIERSGGFSATAETDEVIVIRMNGEVERVDLGFFSGDSSVVMAPGDEIFVLPEVDIKYLTLAGEVSEILFQLAVATRAILDI